MALLADACGPGLALAENPKQRKIREITDSLRKRWISSSIETQIGGKSSDFRSGPHPITSSSRCRAKPLKYKDIKKENWMGE